RGRCPAVAGAFPRQHRPRRRRGRSGRGGSLCHTGESRRQRPWCGRWLAAFAVSSRPPRRVVRLGSEGRGGGGVFQLGFPEAELNRGGTCRRRGLPLAARVLGWLLSHGRDGLGHGRRDGEVLEGRGIDSVVGLSSRLDRAEGRWRRYRVGWTAWK